MNTVHAFTLDDTDYFYSVLISASEVSANKSLPSRMLYDCTNVDVLLQRLFCVETLLLVKAFLRKQNVATLKGMVLDLNPQSDADVRICKTMHRSLVRLLRLICAPGPGSAMFSPLS